MIDLGSSLGLWLGISALGMNAFVESTIITMKYDILVRNRHKIYTILITFNTFKFKHLLTKWTKHSCFIGVVDLIIEVIRIIQSKEFTKRACLRLFNHEKSNDDDSIC